MIDAKQAVRQLLKIQALIEDLKEEFPESTTLRGVEAFENVDAAGMNVDEAIDLLSKEG